MSSLGQKAGIVGINLLSKRAQRVNTDQGVG